jgi:biotin carboxyl carrier protein
MNVAAVKELIAALERSSLASLTYEDAELKISLRRGGAAADAPPLPAPERAPEDEERGVAVKAPVVGTVFRAREPGLAPLVSVGDAVARGDALCVIEAMKIFSEIPAPCDGTVARIAFSDGELAEYGKTLVVLEAGG